MENTFYCPDPYRSEAQKETYTQWFNKREFNKKEKKLLEDNEKNLDDIEFGSDFSDTIPKACSMRERTNKLDFVKIKFLLYMILLRE